MTIEYAQIRERREQVEQARIDRQNVVVSEAQALVEAYEASLNLEKNTWQDIKGISIPYVMAGRVYDEQHFKRCALNTIELNNDYSLSFSISTVIDDSPRGGALSRVDINLSIKDGNGTVGVSLEPNGRKKIFDIAATENKYKDVCEEIKLRVLMSVNDENLIFEEDKSF